METSIWEKQAILKEWHDRVYVKAYPNSRFITGRMLVEGKQRDYDTLPPESKEHKEKVAYMLNKMLLAMGVNIDDRFRED